MGRMKLINMPLYHPVWFLSSSSNQDHIVHIKASDKNSHNDISLEMYIFNTKISCLNSKLCSRIAAHTYMHALIPMQQQQYNYLRHMHIKYYYT